jgi:hypothetical protein
MRGLRDFESNCYYKSMNLVSFVRCNVVTLWLGGERTFIIGSSKVRFCVRKV